MAKKSISIRLDPKIIAYFKSEFPSSYQKGISTVLELHILEHHRAVLAKVAKAQDLYKKNHSRCFGQMPKELAITQELIPMVQQGLRRFGGKKGSQLADDLD